MHKYQEIKAGALILGRRKPELPLNGAVRYAMENKGNKGISSITYNLLNLPVQMDILSPVAEAINTYSYSATGKKLQVVQRWNSNYSTAPVIGQSVNPNGLTRTKTTDYAGNKIYENGVLSKILFENGYYSNGNYYFYIRDHQGNNRKVMDEHLNHIASMDYTPFGVAFQKPSLPFNFNGKELDVMHGLNQYDYSARYYDPAYGRFTTPDPMAEKYYSISLYAYCMNNPLRYIDPSGMTVTTYSDFGSILALLNWAKTSARSNPDEEREKEKEKEKQSSNQTASKQQNTNLMVDISTKNGKTYEVSIAPELSIGVVMGAIMESAKDALVGSAIVASDAFVLSVGAVIGMIFMTGDQSGWKYKENEEFLKTGKQLQQKDDFSQHGTNNVRLEPEELAKLKAKREAGTKLTPSESNKLKAHEKGTKERQSRQSKDNKK